MTQAAPLPPSVIRLKDAAIYLGMNRNWFNENVRPNVPEHHYGRAVAFDKLDLDAWLDKYKASNGRPASRKGGLIKRWDAKHRQAFACAAGSTTSINDLEELEFGKVLDRQVSERQKKC